MNEPALDDAADLLARRVGLRLDHALRGRLIRAVEDEAARNELGLATYVAILENDPDLLQDLLNLVTVQETAFFRDPGQFVALGKDVLPALAETGGPVRIWSAGCANGQEAYSIAMTLAESDIDDWQVIASDVSTEALERTRRARYREREVSGLSATRRARFLQPVERPERGADGEILKWEVASELRDRVHVVRHNLVSDPPPFAPGWCQVVFCRNVLIYFDRKNVVALLDRLSEYLPTGGHLFLGYSESLWQVTDRFRLLRLGDAFVYANEPDPTDPHQIFDTVAPDAMRPPARVEPPPPRSRPAATPASPPDTPRPVSRRESAPPAPPPASTATGSEALADGEAALGRSDYAAAIEAFRRAVFLEPDDPVAHLNLGFALDGAGDDVAARRAYAAARAAIDRCDAAAVEAALEGYGLDELKNLLDLRSRER